MARGFGVSYKGSKNKIGKKLLEQIPPADIFVDLFAGGCAMSHIALLSDKYKKVIANDINKTHNKPYKVYKSSERSFVKSIKKRVRFVRKVIW